MYSCSKFESNLTTWIFHFFMGSPLLNFLHWHLWMTHQKSKGGTPWKSEKSRLSDLTQILHSCTKCNFMPIAKISATFIIENFSTGTNNPTGYIQIVPFIFIKKNYIPVKNWYPYQHLCTQILKFVRYEKSVFLIKNFSRKKIILLKMDLLCLWM